MILEELQERPSFTSFQRMLIEIWRSLTKVINGRISFGDGTEADNIDGIWAAATTHVTPNTDFTVTHNLGRIPVGYLVVKKAAACDIYDGTIAATTTQITLKGTVSAVAIKLFII